MDEALSRYLSIHQSAVNGAAVRIADELAGLDDTDQDARRLVRDSRIALRAAIADVVEAGPIKGERRGMAGEVCVVISVPLDGQGSLGRLHVSAARLGWGPTIPCPDDWPQDSLPLPEAVEKLNKMIFPEPEDPRIVEADTGGSIKIGKRNAGVAYLLTELPEGEIWLRRLDVAEWQDT